MEICPMVCDVSSFWGSSWRGSGNPTMIYTGLWRTMLRRIKSLLQLPERIEEANVLTAQLLVHKILSAGPLEDIRCSEFKVFSQFGDDGIIQYLVHRTHISPAEESFIEFGVENYREANTRFLLINDN